jgi:hypothetical protein
MEKLNFKKNKNNSNIEDDLKLEKEELRLSLRKKKITNIISSKRKILHNIQNANDNKEKYTIELKDIKIPNEWQIDVSKFLDNVRISFIIILIIFIVQYFVIERIFKFY